jgi:hypothetical protein
MGVDGTEQCLVCPTMGAGQIFLIFQVEPPKGRHIEHNTFDPPLSQRILSLIV